MTKFRLLLIDARGQSARGLAQSKTSRRPHDAGELFRLMPFVFRNLGLLPSAATPRLSPALPVEIARCNLAQAQRSKSQSRGNQFKDRASNLRLSPDKRRTGT